MEIEIAAVIFAVALTPDAHLNDQILHYLVKRRMVRNVYLWLALVWLFSVTMCPWGYFSYCRSVLDQGSSSLAPISEEGTFHMVALLQP